MFWKLQKMFMVIQVMLQEINLDINSLSQYPLNSFMIVIYFMMHYQKIEKQYYKSYFGLSKDSVRATLEKKYEVPTRLRDAKYYHLRGCDYFNLQEFSKAVNDFDSAEVLDESFFDIDIYYKAQIDDDIRKLCTMP